MEHTFQRLKKFVVSGRLCEQSSNKIFKFSSFLGIIEPPNSPLRGQTRSLFLSDGWCGMGGREELNDSMNLETHPLVWQIKCPTFTQSNFGFATCNRAPSSCAWQAVPATHVVDPEKLVALGAS